MPRRGRGQQRRQHGRAAVHL
ncbi:MAG TPA: hypothetical protein VL738_04855 [Dactylosporangium sp.]|nr:hypothetical protein [Dactylosporangium sp.]